MRPDDEIMPLGFIYGRLGLFGRRHCNEVVREYIEAQATNTQKNAEEKSNGSKNQNNKSN